MLVKDIYWEKKWNDFQQIQLCKKAEILWDQENLITMQPFRQEMLIGLQMLTRRAYYHMQACGDNVYCWKNYNKKYGVFQKKKEVNLLN